MRPRLVACSFGEGFAQQYPRMARVLAHTARIHCPAWDVDVQVLEAPSLRRPGPYSEGEVANVLKMRHWVEAVRRAPDGTGLALVDADTVILRPLEPVWDQAFDVAYTVRTTSRLPLNAGVVFVRTTPNGRAFVDTWMAEAERMADGTTDGIARWREYRRRYGGMSQAAFGAVLESPVAGATRVLRLNCLEWNCEDTSWRTFDPAVTRIVHVKSELRDAIFNVGPVGPSVRALKPLAMLWRRLEQDALALTG